MLEISMQGTGTTSISFLIYLLSVSPLGLSLSLFLKRKLLRKYPTILILFIIFCLLQLIPLPRIGFKACDYSCWNVPFTIAIGFPISILPLWPSDARDILGNLQIDFLINLFIFMITMLPTVIVYKWRKLPNYKLI